jgi:hypothetical protein
MQIFKIFMALKAVNAPELWHFDPIFKWIAQYFSKRVR